MICAARCRECALISSGIRPKKCPMTVRDRGYDEHRSRDRCSTRWQYRSAMSLASHSASRRNAITVSAVTGFFTRREIFPAAAVKTSCFVRSISMVTSRRRLRRAFSLRAEFGFSMSGIVPAFRKQIAPCTEHLSAGFLLHASQNCAASSQLMANFSHPPLELPPQALADLLPLEFSS